MEHIASNSLVAKPIVVAPTLSITPQQRSGVTGPSTTETGQDSSGGQSQGRSWEQADAYRPLTFQDVLLSSTTLTSLHDVLSRLSNTQVDDGTSDRRSAARVSSGDTESTDDGASTSAEDVAEAGQGTAQASATGNTSSSGKTSERTWSLRSLLSGAGTGSSGVQVMGGPVVDDDSGYSGPDWAASGQLLDASRRAVQVYQQSLAALPGSGFVGRADVLDLVA